MRRILSLASILLVALSGTACVSGPTPEQMLAVSYRTPELAFASFQTAFRGNLKDLEYRSFSNALKARIGSQIFYREARAKILAEQPFIKLAATAKVTRVTRAAGGNHCRLELQIDRWFYKHVFAVDMIREGSYDVLDEDGVAEGVPIRWSKIASTHWDPETDKGELVVRVPMPEGYDSIEELTGITAGLAWKIDEFITIDSP